MTIAEWFRTKASNAAFRIGTSNKSLLIPTALFAAIGGFAFASPQTFTDAFVVDLKLRSEEAIPKVTPKDDIVWRFRYAETGTEFRSGVPYWIFKIMPRLMPDAFGGRGYDWFGFDDDDNEYHQEFPLPRGFALSDTNVRSPLLRARIMLKRVSLNCSGCHRGEYLDAEGVRHFVDGMPNHTADLQGFKRFYAHAFQDQRFEGDAVVKEIDHALTETHHDPLDHREEFLYRALVQQLRADRSDLGKWMDSRPENGPGRIDPFNAVKFEVLGAKDDGTAATLDFPSIWNQRANDLSGQPVRTWHHSDGNTQDSDARNFGSIIGVGGIPLSVNKDGVNKIGAWLSVLAPKKYPFGDPLQADVDRGAKVFADNCARCHGDYHRSDNTFHTSTSPSYMQVVDVGTDPERRKAFQPGVAKALNEYGDMHGLWNGAAFRGDQGRTVGEKPDEIHTGYLCGPLDGIWARAPYLHNGSVPNLDELLKPADQRSKTFFRGNPKYDTVSVGWVSSESVRPGGIRELFRYDTTLPGNSNQGHEFPIDDETDRSNLLAYLRTL